MRKISILTTTVCIILTLLISCSGKRNKPSQTNTERNSNSEHVAQQGESEIAGSFIISNSGVPEAISLPLSLAQYVQAYGDLPTYQPSVKLVDYMKKLGYEGSEYRCHLLPFPSENVMCLLVWVNQGDSEYYFIVTFDLKENKIIDSAHIGEATDESLISFLISDDFYIQRYRGRYEYSESEDANHIVEKQSLNYIQIESNGQIKIAAKPIEDLCTCSEK